MHFGTEMDITHTTAHTHHYISHFPASR